MALAFVSPVHGLRFNPKSQRLCTHGAARRSARRVRFTAPCMQFGGGGFLGVGPAEVVVIVVVGWFILGPKELIRVSKEAGKVLGSLRASAYEARTQLTSALEMENITDEYQKTVNAFRKGLDGVEDDGNDADEGAKSEKDSALKVEEKNVDPEHSDKSPVEPAASSEKMDEAVEAAAAEMQEQASRFREQLQRVEAGDGQVPPPPRVEADIPQELDGATKADLVELERGFEDERAKLELELLEKKYDAMRRKILERQASAKADADDRGGGAPSASSGSADDKSSSGER